MIGYARYTGGDLRYFISLGNVASFAYDNNGHVAMNVTDIVNITQESTFPLHLWPTNKDVTVDGWIKAIRIGD